MARRTWRAAAAAQPAAHLHSIALLANNFDVKWVMSQVGHADSKMTLDVYAQLEQRVQRDHGAGFDRLVRRARAQLDSGWEEPLAASAA